VHNIIFPGGGTSASSCPLPMGVHATKPGAELLYVGILRPGQDQKYVLLSATLGNMRDRSHTIFSGKGQLSYQDPPPQFTPTIKSLEHGWGRKNTIFV